MKIAIPTANEKKIFPHFGRTPGVLVLTVEGNNIINKEYIPNDFTGHAKGNHHEHHHEHGGGHGQGHGGGAHTGIFNAIGDCDVVIAGGMGRRLYDEFLANNIEVFITDEHYIDRAVDLYLAKQLDSKDDNLCKH